MARGESQVPAALDLMGEVEASAWREPANALGEE
jgi:hypothetical protein